MRGFAYSFRWSVHCHHRGKPGSVRADIVLERQLRILHLDQWATGCELCPTLGMAKHETSKPIPIVTYFLVVPLPIGQAFEPGPLNKH